VDLLRDRLQVLRLPEGRGEANPQQQTKKQTGSIEHSCAFKGLLLASGEICNSVSG
jgi:hypothetical protein